MAPLLRIAIVVFELLMLDLLDEAYNLALVRTVSRLQQLLLAALLESLLRPVFSSMCNDVVEVFH